MATKPYKGDLGKMELRRREGMRLLASGVSQSEVARQLDVSRQTTSSWAKRLAEDPQAWRWRSLGRPSGLSEAQKRGLGKALSAGTQANGFPNNRWTLALVAQLIERKFGLSYSIVNVWRILHELGIHWRRPGLPGRRPLCSRPRSARAQG